MICTLMCGYGSVMVSMVERISGLPIVDARYLFDFGQGVCVCYTAVQKKCVIWDEMPNMWISGKIMKREILCYDMDNFG